MPRGIYIRTPEICESMRLNRLGKTDSPKTRALKSKRAQERANDPEWREKVSQGTRKAFQRPEVRKKLKENAAKLAIDKEFSEICSEATRKAMRRPDVRKRHLQGLSDARRKHGVNFKGGQHQEPVPFVKLLAESLSPIGFVQEHPILRPGKKGRFLLDFAHLAAKVAIEADGPAHRSFSEREKDAARDVFLKSLGWRVIRVKHD